MAWLHSAPKIYDKEEKPKTRMSKLSDKELKYAFPKVDSYLIEAFKESGVCLDGVNGATSLTWDEIESFSEKSTFDLNRYDSELIIMMSRDYCSFSIKARETNCSSPYESKESISAMRKRVNDQINGLEDVIKRAD